jgi:hypothetical protein
MTDEIQATPAAALSTSDADAAPPPPAFEADNAKPEISLAEIAPTKAAAPSIKTAPGTPTAEIKVVGDVSDPSPHTGTAAATAGIAEAPARGNRFALLAASVALAAAAGAVAGALGASAFTRSAPSLDQTAIAAAATEKTDVLQSTINRMQTELAALRTSVEAGTRATNGQFSKITEHFDRVERMQTERAAKLIKAMESLERVERRAETAPVREVTGSVPAPQPVAATPAQSPQPPQAAQPPRPPVVEGWVVRTVYRGTAILQNRRIGTIDVEPGDVLPGVGRIESIKKQDGKWVVVTAKGLITSVR